MCSEGRRRELYDDDQRGREEEEKKKYINKSGKKILNAGYYNVATTNLYTSWNET